MSTSAPTNKNGTGSDRLVSVPHRSGAETRPRQAAVLSAATGPDMARTLADRFREAGLSVLCVGVEQVLVEVDERGGEGFAETFFGALRETHETTFNLSAPRALRLVRVKQAA